MYLSARRLVAAVATILIAVAILGYVAGHDRSHATTVGQSRTISASDLLLVYPADWHPVTASLTIPGLTLANPVMLAPDGDATHAGLLTGQLPADEPSPLPKRFMEDVRSPPVSGVVKFVETQAYRYTGLHVDGFSPALSVYVIPNPGGNPTALACYASAAFAASMRTCEQIVATLTLVGLQPSYELTPITAYAHSLHAWVGALDERRVALRRELATITAPSTVRVLATRLARGFAAASESLSLLKPPSAIGQAQTTLLQSILRVRDAYTALADAAASESSSRFAAARARVYEDEAGVNTALESFALYGYTT